MNKELCLEFVNSFDFIKKGQVVYSKLFSGLKIENKMDSKFLMLLDTTSYQRAEDFFTLQNGIPKLKGILPPDKYNELMDAVEKERQLAVMIHKCCQDYTNTKDVRYLTAISRILYAEDKYINNLNQAFTMVENQFGILLVSAAFNNQVSIEDIRELGTSLKPGSNIQKNMEQLVITLERRNQKEAEKVFDIPDIEVPEQKQSEEENLTLQEKLNQINYSIDGNLVAEIQELTIEDRIHQIEKSIAELTSKQNFSFKELLTLHSLEEERLQLEAYSSTLGDMKLSRSQTKRDKKMRTVTMKLDENNNKLENSKENYEKYRSKIARFFSARYQKNLIEKIQKLQTKRGTLQEKQKQSAIAKFDKKSGKIVRRARVVGFGNTVKDYKDDAIASLKSLRNEIVEEFEAMRRDYSRFKSSKKDIADLKNKTGIMPEVVVPINQYRIEQHSEKVA